MLSTKIKEYTKDAHQQLEKKVVLQLKNIRSNEDYAALLRYFYAYFNAVERAIKPYITEQVLPDYAERRHSGYLKADIEELGGTTEQLPAVQVPKISNVIEALGALYVMEGSIIGGSIIVQMLAKYGITQGVSFFSGYGDATAQMWGKFIAVLNEQVRDEKQENQAIKSANYTFRNFSEMFGEVGISG